MCLENDTLLVHKRQRGRRGLDRMVVGFTTTHAISAYHHWWSKFESRLATGRWFPPPIKMDRHDITEILLKVALNTIKQTNIKHNDILLRFGCLWLVTFWSFLPSFNSKYTVSFKTSICLTILLRPLTYMIYCLIKTSVHKCYSF